MITSDFYFVTVKVSYEHSSIITTRTVIASTPEEARSKITSEGTVTEILNVTFNNGYAVSDCEENYYNSRIRTIEECHEIAQLEGWDRYYVCECRTPTHPADLIDFDICLDDIGVDEMSWGGDWAEWDGHGAEPELESSFHDHLREAARYFFNTNDLQPNWWIGLNTMEFGGDE